MNTVSIGTNAGTVWRTLHNNKCSWEELLKATGLNPLDLACAIGWLAREDKIIISQQGGIVYFEVYHECYY